MPDRKEIITVPVKLVKELPSSLIVTGEARYQYLYSPIPHPRRRKVVIGEDGKEKKVPTLEPIRIKFVGGTRTKAYANARGFMVPVRCRVPKSKVISHGLGVMTLPRWLAEQAGLI